MADIVKRLAADETLHARGRLTAKSQIGYSRVDRHRALMGGGRLFCVQDESEPSPPAQRQVV
jgi:hypothetical protein